MFETSGQLASEVRASWELKDTGGEMAGGGGRVGQPELLAPEERQRQSLGLGLNIVSVLDAVLGREETSDEFAVGKSLHQGRTSPCIANFYSFSDKVEEMRGLE